MIWEIWWSWAAAALILGILEVIAPGFIFLGFALGAIVVSLLLLVGVTLSLPGLILILALVSLGSWLALRQAFGIRRGQKKIIDTDINED